MGMDRWARWLLRDRDGGAPESPVLGEYRDGVLDRAAVGAGDLLLDVGTGTGLVAFGALERGAQVVFSDVSADLLTECRRRATAAGVLDRCRFVRASADDLRELPDRSVDVVTTRSVLIYLERKDAAFAEFFRVLRPGGRLSLFEPINRFAVDEPDRLLFGLDLAPVAGLVAKLWRAYDGGADQSLVDFDERDLLRWARAAGFTAIGLDYRAEVRVPRPMPGTDWEVLKRTSPNPLAPTFQEAMARTLTAEERERFEDHVRALLAAGAPSRTTMATAYLRAVRMEE